MALRASTYPDAAPSKAPALIRYDGVCKSFKLDGGALQAVRDINLEIARGEIITLVGPSGCGKSTLLNMAAGLFPPTEGAVYYEGESLTAMSRRVGYMTQSDHLLPWRTVFGNIMAPLEIQRMEKRKARERVESLLETVGLSGFGGSYPSQISGGMRKRTALARLLAYDPQTLLMDEPFGALDALLRLRLQIELRVLAKRLNKTVLFVTHDLEEAVALGDRCAVFSARPGTIISVVPIPLPADRDLMRLRYNEDFTRTCSEIWTILSSELSRSSP